MYFKQIEMTGFKSFADRTVVNLESGMTAIVGPNGCGKSNILDAIRWALGEQRAKSLRGAHMQDVIFNGSEDRAPTGMSEVTLVFDNSDSSLPIDFSEVQVTRRVYRSGESEYLINRAPCRLRDVLELFMDTGIGTNAYSMIGQGMISMVLSSKPEDRRYLFEEAAGIVKYKNRKKVALRKLDQAEQNLLRLGDIVAEIERQMRSLKRQVNAAIRYRELSDQLRELEIRAAWLKHNQLSANIAQLRERFSDAQKRFEQESAQSTKLEARQEELSLQKLEIDRVLHARREGVHEIEAGMERAERQIALIRQQVQFCEDQRIRAAGERDSFLARGAEINERSAEAESRRAALESERDSTQAAYDAKRAEFNACADRVAAADAALEQARSEAMALMGRRAEAQTSIETLTVSIENVDGQLELLFERQEDDTKRAEALLAELESKRREQSETQSKADAAEVRMRQAREEQDARAAALARLNEEWQQLREQRSSVQARLTSLRELRDSYEGFAAGVRAIMLAKQQDRAESLGVIGPIGDLVSTDSRFERAIEAALGGNVNNIAVETAESAKAAIRFLKENKAGRVTFLPLDTIRPGDRDDVDRVAGRPGVVGPAIEFVRFDATLARAMQYVFHNTVIVETIDHAIDIARSESRYPRFVTLDGEVVSASGAVTGGRTAHEKGGLIGRSAEIAELEKREAAIAAQVADLGERGKHAAEAVESSKQEIASIGAEQSALAKILAALGIEIARLSTDADRIAESHQRLASEREALSEKRRAYESERKSAYAQAQSMETEEERLQRLLAEAQEAAVHAREQQSRLGDELSELRIALAAHVQRIEENERDSRRLKLEHEEALAEAGQRVRAMEELEAQKRRLEESIKDEIERVKALAESKEEARKTVVEAENRRQALLDESEALEKDLRGFRDRLRESQSAVHRIEIDLRHDEDQLAFFHERILSEYRVHLAKLSEEDAGQDEHSDEAREQIVKELRTKLERMGTVNLMAIEEYDALTERHAFLAEQFGDLSKARESLLDVVKRIDVTIRDMFLSTFNDVAENFHEYFRRLFNGGHARIYLLDEDDPLECGIEIEARPPGKKPQLISLLSGGEQAMTAIALLFSIFKAKPSPFCVLDEVDAPLDDANIGRFLNLLDEFAADTQFIVITHNKQTMARAGALYGVTQQERGVSQLVSVKFDEVPETADTAA